MRKKRRWSNRVSENARRKKKDSALEKRGGDAVQGRGKEKKKKKARWFEKETHHLSQDRQKKGREKTLHQKERIKWLSGGVNTLAIRISCRCETKPEKKGTLLFWEKKSCRITEASQGRLNESI